MSVRAKFKVESIKVDEYGTTVALTAVTTGAGNESWSKWTPSGSLVMQITNPDASSQFKVGEAYFLDLMPVAFGGGQEVK